MSRPSILAVVTIVGACGGTPQQNEGARKREAGVSTTDAGTDGATMPPSEGDRRARLRAMIAAESPDAAEAIVAAVADPDPLMRSEAAYQLAATHHPRALPLLTKLADDRAPVVRVMVVEALAGLGGAEAQRQLFQFAVEDPSEDVRATMARALEGIEGPDAERALERLARDPVVVVRDRATAIRARRAP